MLYISTSFIFNSQDDDIGPRKISILVARYILDVTDVGSARYEKARSYAELANYFADTEYGAQEVAIYLHKNGIRRSLEYFKDAERTASTLGDEDDEQHDEDMGLVDGLSSSSQEGADRGKGRPPSPPSRPEIMKHALSKTPPSNMTRPKLNLETMLVTEASDQHLRYILETSIGETVTLKVRRERGHEGQNWKRFVVVGVEG